MGIDSARVGVIGFSAGGELAALGSQRTLAAKPGAADVVERQDSKPAFQALIYPGNANQLSLLKTLHPLSWSVAMMIDRTSPKESPVCILDLEKSVCLLNSISTPGSAMALAFVLEIILRPALGRIVLENGWQTAGFLAKYRNSGPFTLTPYP